MTSQTPAPVTPAQRSNNRSEAKSMVVIGTIGILLAAGFSLFGEPQAGLLTRYFCGLPGLLLILYSALRFYTFHHLGEPDVRLSKEAVKVGESFTVAYRRPVGRRARVRRLTIKLVFREANEYLNSKDRRRVKVHDEVVASFTHQTMSQSGQSIDVLQTMQIPLDGMHTLKVSHSRILTWLVVVELDVMNLPDVSELYEVVVLPEIAMETQP